MVFLTTEIETEDGKITIGDIFRLMKKSKEFQSIIETLENIELLQDELIKTTQQVSSTLDKKLDDTDPVLNEPREALPHKHEAEDVKGLFTKEEAERLISTQIKELKVKLDNLPEPQKIDLKAVLKTLRTEIDYRLSNIKPDETRINQVEKKTNELVDLIDGVIEKAESELKEVQEKLLLELSKRINEGEKQVNIIGGINIGERLKLLKDVSIENPNDGDSLVYNLATKKWVAAASSGGGIESIVAGTNISVDNTDPANPIVATIADPTFSTEVNTPITKATTSAGGELRTSNDTVALHYGSGAGANGTLYGGWNYDNGTAESALYLGSSKTFSTNAYYKYDATAFRLESYSGLGSELMPNGGTFTGSAAGWALATGWAYASNAVSKTSNGVGTLQPSSLSVIANQRYDYSLVVSALTVGSVTLTCGGVTLATISANGTYSGSFLTTSNANWILTPTNTARLTVDNVSLKQRTGGSVYTSAIVTNTSTAIQSGLATTTADGVIVDNPTDATSGVPAQVSPAIKWRGRGFKTNDSTSATIDFRAYVLPTTSTTPYGMWKLQHSTNSAAFADLFSVSSDAGATATTVQITTAGAQSNGSPASTRALAINNSGSNTWLDFNFSGVTKVNIGADSSGELKLYQGGGSGVAFYNKASGGTLYSYNTSTAFVHTGFGEFTGGVMAGTIAQPTSTLQTAGGTALKVKRVTSAQTLDNTASKWLLDATNAAACTGTPSNTCASHGSEGACTSNDSHGGCTWNAGSSCSVFNYESGMTTCSGTSGCTTDTALCSGGDESTCLANDDAYGGNCSWNGSDCSVYNGNEGTCGSTSGCSVSSSNTCPSQPDEGSCTGAGCSWNGSSCDGDNSTCSGTYYTCGGSYNTGNCSGVYGSGCTGTPTCAGINDSTSCGAETGCTWSSVLNIALPDGETCPDRDYWLYNDSTGGQDVVITPYSGQTINETTSYTLASYRDWIHISYFKQTAECSELANQAACEAQTGCSANLPNCSWNSGDNTCTGGAGCSGYGDQSSCEAATYYAGCSGTYAIRKNWYKFGS